MRADIRLQLRCTPDQSHWESHLIGSLTNYCAVCCVQWTQEVMDVLWVQVSVGGQIAYDYVEVCQHLVKCFCVFGYLNEVNCYGCVEMYQPFGEANYFCVFVSLNVNGMIYVCVQYVQHTWMSLTDYCHCYCLVY